MALHPLIVKLQIKVPFNRGNGPIEIPHRVVAANLQENETGKPIFARFFVEQDIKGDAEFEFVNNVATAEKRNGLGM